MSCDAFLSVGQKDILKKKLSLEDGWVWTGNGLLQESKKQMDLEHALG